ncbi:MAG: hypothetical protein HY286_10020 [Planctomycetes bacterium]|nr:hypothetical protein [Planctomycetota bacterium]
MKIDEDRMKGGKDLLKKFCENSGGIPWIAFVDGSGKVLADGMENGKNNIGFPAKPNEIAWFMGMIAKVKKNMTDDDVKFIERSLEEDKKAHAR